MEQAKSEGREAAEILDDAHMIFTGPPGTGRFLPISFSLSRCLFLYVVFIVIWLCCRLLYPLYCYSPPGASCAQT